MVARPNAALAQIHSQVMWSRLIAVVEEQAQTMIRTAFSTSVREAGDLSAGVFDRDGRMLAQAVTGTPGHVNSMANAVVHFLKAYPLETMKPGDHYITNDPWQTSGHLHDITVVTPSFYNGKPVGLFASTVHVVDIGGLGMGPDGRQVFEEGLSIPLMPLAREGRMNEDLLGILRANVREPLQVEGDVYALAACNDEGSRRLVEMMEEFGLANLDRLGEHIIETASAPGGCPLNVKRPRAVAARHRVGHMLPDVVFGCLHQVMPGGVPAEGASSLWNPQIYGGADVLDEFGAGEHGDVAPFSTVIFHCGGTGARPGKDGLDVTAFPSGGRTIPVEATESIAPGMFRRREFREGSGGAGRYRGGLGPVIELGGADGMPVALLCNFERINHPARGSDGGGLCAPGPLG